MLPKHSKEPKLSQVAELDELSAGKKSVVPSLRNNFVWTFAGNALYAACQWGMLSVLAKLGSATIVGQFTLGLAIAAPIFMFTNLQLRTVQATDVHAESEFGTYFTLRFLATSMGLTLVTTTLPFIKGTRTTCAVVFLVALSKSIECMSDVIAGLLQREELLRRVAISLMIRGVGSVLAFVWIFASTHDLILTMLGMNGVWLGVFLVYDLPNAKTLMNRQERFFQIDLTELKKLAILSLPLGWAGTLASLNANIPRYFLQHYSGLAEQGIYSSLAYLVIAMGLIVLALSQSVMTRLSQLFAGGERKLFARLLLRLSMFGVLISVLGTPLALLAGRPFLTFVYRREYGDHANLLALLVGASGMMTIAAFLLCGMNAARLFRVQVPLYLGASVTCVLSCFILVPRYGLVGAGVSVLFSSLIIALCCAWVMARALTTQACVVYS